MAISSTTLLMISICLFYIDFYHILIQPGSVNVFSVKPCSSGLIFFWVSYGDVYSTERIWYWLFKQSSRLLRMKPSVLFPLPTIFSLCLSQNNSSLMVTLRHLLASTMHTTCFHLVCWHQLFISLFNYSYYNAFLG